MRFTLLELYRPTRSTDGRHGYTDTYGTATNLWGEGFIHENTPTLIYRDGEDVKVDDVVVADDGCYRVMSVGLNLGSGKRNAGLERIQRPIFPDGESCEGSGSG